MTETRDTEIRLVYLLTWDTRYVVVDSKDMETLLDVEPFFDELTLLEPDEELTVRLFGLEYTSECDEYEEEMQIIAENFTLLLKEDVVSIVSTMTVDLKGIPMRGPGVEQHRSDVRRYYMEHPIFA